MDDATTDPVVVVGAGYAGVMAANRLGDVRLLMTGGEFVVWAEAFFGPISVATVRNLHADAVFMSGLHRGGWSHLPPRGRGRGAQAGDAGRVAQGALRRPHQVHADSTTSATSWTSTS